MARTWLLRTHLEGSFQKRCTEQNPPNNYDINSHGTITSHDMKTPRLLLSPKCSQRPSREATSGERRGQGGWGKTLGQTICVSVGRWLNHTFFLLCERRKIASR